MGTKPLCDRCKIGEGTHKVTRVKSIDRGRSVMSYYKQVKICDVCYNLVMKPGAIKLLPPGRHHE